MSKPTSQTRRIEVFRAGTFQAMNGQSYAFTASDVSEIAAAYDATSNPAPVVVGHPTHDDPAFGWASGFEVDDRGVLVAELDNLAPSFVAAVSEGRYRKVSMSFFGPEAPNNPKPGQYYPRHIGFLGGAAPAVSGLTPVAFKADDEGTVEIELAAPELNFTDYGLKDTAKVFRSIREWIIEKFGMEEADKAVDSWYVDWIDDAADAKSETADVTSYAAPKVALKPHSPTTQRQQMTKPAVTFQEDTMSNTDFAAREARITERERALAETENANFADALVADGHVAAGSRDRLVALLGAIPADAEELSFAEGSQTRKAGPRALLQELLSSAPASLPEGQVVTGQEDAPRRGPSFAAPEGFEVSREDMDLFAKAQTYQTNNPGVSFADAAIAVQNQEA